MLYQLEWQTPHETPGGRSVADWVDGVRWLEENKYLRDPNELDWPADPEHPANRSRARDNMFCPPLCWRKRCHRVDRCLHMMPLAIREFMPEFCVHLNTITGEPQPYHGPINPDKMTILAEIFGPGLHPAPNPRSRLPIFEPLTSYFNRDE